MTKQCNKCQQAKPLSEYPKDKRCKDGSAGGCLSCVRRTKTAWREKNRERIRTAGSAWRRANPDKIRDIAQRSYIRHADKVKAKSREYKLNHPTKRRERDLRVQYGLTLAEFNQMVDAQRGLCAICQSPPMGSRYKKLHIDHDHATGKVRGLLCDKHNRAIGLFGDDPEMLTKAAMYLAEHERIWLSLAA